MQDVEQALRLYYQHYKQCHSAHWKNRLWELVVYNFCFAAISGGKKKLNVSALVNSAQMSAKWDSRSQSTTTL